MKFQMLSLLFIFSLTLTVQGQDTYVPDNNFENYLETHTSNGTNVPLGDPTSMGNGVMDDYVLTANISSVWSLDIQHLSISDMTGLEDFEGLTSLNCDNNQITSLNFHPNANLNDLICQNNLLTSIDVSQHTDLMEFGCGNNNITSLDLSQNTNLFYLYVYGTLINELDTNELTNLREIFCGNNINLTSLNLTQNPNLYAIYASNNASIQYVDLRSGNNTNLNGYDVIFNNSPNLDFIYVDDCTYSTNNWTNIDSPTIFIENEGEIECSGLSIDDYQLENSISLYPNPVVNTLFLDNISNLNIKNISIYNFEGKLILEQKLGIEKIDFQNYNSGMYFLVIQSERGILTKKIVKN